MPRPFLIYPDRRLKAVAAPVEAVDDAVEALWDEMLEAMYAMPGIGLAAPQIGVGLRLAVLDCSDSRDQPVRLANPQIVAAGAETARDREGSPNLPGLWADVTRPAAVTVRFLGPGGAEETRDFAGRWARSVQHQIDHLDGRLFIDRLSPVKRRMLVAKHMKQARRAGRGR